MICPIDSFNDDLLKDKFKTNGLKRIRKQANDRLKSEMISLIFFSTTIDEKYGTHHLGI